MTTPEEIEEKRKQSKMPKIKLFFNNKAKIDIKTKNLIKKACGAVLVEENYVENVEISVTLTDNREIRSINREYRNKDYATDVLSFPMGDKNYDTGCIMLGDIVISVERANEQANEYGHSLEREIAFLTIHSMLHLLGYDHEENEEDEAVMREKQTRLLNTIGLEI